MANVASGVLIGFMLTAAERIGRGADRARPAAYAPQVRDFDPSAYGASGIAEEYDDLYAGHWETDAAVDCVARLAEGGSVLELGIGTGRLALPLGEWGVEVLGVDGSGEMV